MSNSSYSFTNVPYDVDIRFYWGEKSKKYEPNVNKLGIIVNNNNRLGIIKTVVIVGLVYVWTTVQLYLYYVPVVVKE